MVRFGKKRKLCPGYAGPSKIVRRFSNVEYGLEFPLEMNTIHSVFHVSILRKIMGDTKFIVPLEDVNIEENFIYEEVPMEIQDRLVNKLRNKDVVSIKIL